MGIHSVSGLSLAALLLGAGCANEAADREENTGTLLENATPPPAARTANDAGVPAPPSGERVLPADYGVRGTAETVPPSDSAATADDNGAVQMRTDSATPVGPVP